MYCNPNFGFAMLHLTVCLYALKHIYSDIQKITVHTISQNHISGMYTRNWNQRCCDCM